MKIKRLVLTTLLCLCSGVFLAADYSHRAMESRVVETALSNGLKVAMVPRYGAPVASFVIYADVGGVNEQQNATVIWGHNTQNPTLKFIKVWQKARKCCIRLEIDKRLFFERQNWFINGGIRRSVFQKAHLFKKGGIVE